MTKKGMVDEVVECVQRVDNVESPIKLVAVIHDQDPPKSSIMQQLLQETA